MEQTTRARREKEKSATYTSRNSTLGWLTFELCHRCKEPERVQFFCERTFEKINQKRRKRTFYPKCAARRFLCDPVEDLRRDQSINQLSRVHFIYARLFSARSLSLSLWQLTDISFLDRAMRSWKTRLWSSQKGSYDDFRCSTLSRGVLGGEDCLIWASVSARTLD